MQAKAKRMASFCRNKLQDNEPMDFTEITTSLIHDCTSTDGTRYVRFCATNWAQWMGESLEIVQDPEDNAELEAAYAKSGLHFK